MSESFLEAVAMAQLARARNRYGIPQQEQAAAESQTAQIMRQLQAKRLMQQLEGAPAAETRAAEAHTSQIGLEGAQKAAALALAGSRENPKPKDPAAIGSFEDYVVQKYGPRPTPEQI